MPNTFVHFLGNHAQNQGAAITVGDAASITDCVSNMLTIRGPCFFQILNKCNVVINSGVPLETSIHLEFEENFAALGGNDLYGGALERCTVCSSSFSVVSGLEALTTLTRLPVSHYSGTPLISSNPFRVCICEHLVPNCSLSNVTHNVYPGETVSVHVVAVGQVNGTVSAVIHATLENSKGFGLVDHLQSTQPVGTNCSSLEYALLKVPGQESMELSVARLNLFAEGPCGEFGYSVSVVFNLLPCPSGFSLSQSGVCDCEKRLRRYAHSCNVDSNTITRTTDFWVGHDHHTHGLVLHPHCPFDYCTLETVAFTLNSTDLQCAHGRSGTLCGGCKSGLSLNLGSSQCSTCSNVYVLLILPLAVAGFLLVVFLFTCKLTVAAGTTSGLIFYANVVAANQALLFPVREVNTLTMFVAWLNLDLGIETCLFDGMDAYSHMWLQFVFPLYIWSLVGLITLVAYYSMTVARIIGPTNPVAVLATLFLLSYAKLLRTIIATFSFTTLEYPNEAKVTVWVYDGNIRYLEGKHIALFLAGLLVFLLLFLPYTLLLVFGQWIQAGSNYKLLSWASNSVVKSFLDAYHAPYKNQHRYWIGLLLVVRFILFTISAIIDINSPRDPSVNLLVLVTLCTVLTVWTWNAGSMYKKWLHNVLESSVILNLAILAAATYHVKVTGGNKQAVVYTSVSVAFMTFILIVAYHIMERVADTRIWRISLIPLLTRLKSQLLSKQQHEDSVQMSPTHVTLPPQVTTTFIDLRETLLESQ